MISEETRQLFYESIDWKHLIIYMVLFLMLSLQFFILALVNQELQFSKEVLDAFSYAYQFVLIALVGLFFVDAIGRFLFEYAIRWYKERDTA